MPKPTTVLFDVYGTLIDIQTNERRDDIFESLSRFLEYRRVFLPAGVLKELYFSALHLQFARSRERFPEVDAAKAFEHVLRDQGQSGDRFLALVTTQLYRALSRERFGLFPETFWTLAEFRKRYRIGLVTDAQRVYCYPELRALRIEDFFDARVISSDYGFRKPDPRLFRIALAALKGEPEEAVYIGNKYDTDLLGAKRAGFALVGLIHQTEEDRKTYHADIAPDFVADTLKAAYEIVVSKTA